MLRVRALPTSVGALSLLFVSAAANGRAECPSLKPKPNAGKVVTVTDKQNKSKQQLTVGDELVVRLEVRLGTGYSYQVAKGAAKVLQPIGKPKIEPGDKKPGSKEFQVFRFRAKAEGKDKLELHYRRPFGKKDVPPAKVFRLEVTVKPNRKSN